MKVSPESKYSRARELSITLFEDEVKSVSKPTALSLLLYLGTRLKFFPFVWDYHESRLIVNSVSARAHFFTNLAFVFAYASFKFYLSLRNELLDNPNKIHSVVECLFFVLFALALLLSFNNVYHADDIVAFMNTYLWRVRVEISNYFDTQNTIQLLEVFWNGYVRTLHLILISSIPLLLKGKFSTQLYVNSGPMNNLLQLCFILMDLYSLYAFLIIMGFYTYFIVDCTIVVEKLSQSMRCRINQIACLSASSSRIEELKFVQKCCNEIHITVASYKAIMESLVLPVLLSVTTMVSSLGLFTVIKFYGELGIIFSMMLSLAETFCISLTSLGLCKVSRMCTSNEFIQRELCQLIPTKVRKEQRIMMTSIQPIFANMQFSALLAMVAPCTV